MEGHYPRYSTGIHDNLTASILSINKNFLFISLDLVAIPAYRVDRIKRKILEQYNIKSDRIIINAIHTHSGPTVTDLLIDYPEIDNNYWQLIDQQILVGVGDAINNESQVKLKLLHYQVADGIYANRNSKDLPYNKNIMELLFEQKNEIKASILFIATHPTVMNIKNTLISADLIEGVRLQCQGLHSILKILLYIIMLMLKSYISHFGLNKLYKV